MESRVLLALAATCAACAPEQSAIDGYYQLVRIGDEAPAVVAARPGDCFIPTSSEFQLSRGRLISIDSIPLLGDCQQQASPEHWQVVSVDTGTYRLAGDTLHFYVPDTTVGVKGWVNYGFRRGDTLVFLAGEFDPGDYIYVRSRRDRQPPPN